MSGRERLPARRHSATIGVEWRSRQVNVSVGFSPAGAPLEAFARAGKPDSDLDTTADDIAVLLSLLLQHGANLQAIAHSLGRLPDGTPASITGAIVAAALQLAKAPA